MRQVEKAVGKVASSHPSIPTRSLLLNEEEAT